MSSDSRFLRTIFPFACLSSSPPLTPSCADKNPTSQGFSQCSNSWWDRIGQARLSPQKKKKNVTETPGSRTMSLLGVLCMVAGGADLGLTVLEGGALDYQKLAEAGSSSSSTTFLKSPDFHNSFVLSIVLKAHQIQALKSKEGKSPLFWKL